MKHTLLIATAALALGGCTLEDLMGPTTRSAMFDATSTQELTDMGAQRLDALSIIEALDGSTLIEPEQDWTWDVRSDGTQQARDNPDDTGFVEWEDAPGGSWEVADGRFCHQTEDMEMKCREVYQLGNFFRMTEPDGSLANWTVTKG